MSLKKISTTLLVATAVTVMVVLAFRVRAGATADSIAVLRTTGMTCGSCSSKITKALDSQKGVAVTEVDIDGGWVIVGYDKKEITPQRLAERVKGTGFYSQVTQVLTPDEFRRLTGRNVGQNPAQGSGCCGGKGGGCGANNKG